MYQREQSAFNRPPLGFEASANLIGGINTELHFKPAGVSRLLSGLTTDPATAPSLFDVNAEFAFTKPDPNRSGQAYLEEFEAEAGIPVSLRETAWEFGSRPQQADGVEDIGFAGGFRAGRRGRAHLAEPGAGRRQQSGPGAPPAGHRHPDPVLGPGERLETVMYLTLHADTAGGVVQQNNHSRWSLPAGRLRPRWRSMVTSLSPTGVDLSHG